MEAADRRRRARCRLHPADGKFTVDQGSTRSTCRPITTITETYDIPNGGIPISGKFFTTMGNRNPVGRFRAVPTAFRRDRTATTTTDTVSGQIGEFGPKARTYVGTTSAATRCTTRCGSTEGARVVHERVLEPGRDVRYEDRQDDAGHLPLTDRLHASAVPYGIDVNPVDGSVWYSSLMANRLGRIDGETLKVESFKPPTIGPRRMRFAPDGTLWIPDFGQGQLVRLDTKRMEYKSYPIPPLSPDEIEAPYALGVDPKTQDVWITANMSDRMFRFLPKEERFISYPLPTQGIYLRDIIFTPDGMVCSASSPMPAPVTVEGGMQEIVCVDPVGDLPLPRPASGSVETEGWGCRHESCTDGRCDEARCWRHAAVPAGGARQLEEIIVTARKRAEPLQKTPVSITAFTVDQLEKPGMDDLIDVARFAPNVVFDQGTGNTGGQFNSQLFIRGIGQVDFLFSSDPGVGVYVDEVYLPRVVGSLMDVMDLERVEVLRGPQGTLFGKNTIGGALNITSLKPSGEFGAVADVTFGSRDHRRPPSVASPIARKLYLRITASTRNQEQSC